MIPKEYVTFETAKLLKQAGFPQDGCEKIYSVPTGKKRNGYFGREDVCEYIPKPTQAQAMRWLRDEKNLFVEISFDPGFARPPYYVEIQTLPEGGFIGYIGYPMAHSTYEEAAEAGIQAACEYLIEKGGVR